MFGRKLNNMSNELYFVIRVWNFPHNDTIQYNIVSDKAYDMSKAMNIKIAQDIMETNENISYQLQKVNLVDVGKSKLAS
tara:strand:- start:252 stop:488 length:237 start_codon:yes stop_codon:yes gene_type:complete